MAIYADLPNTSIFQMGGLRQLQYGRTDPDGYPMGPALAQLANGAQRGMGLHAGVKKAGGKAPDNRKVYATGDDGAYQMGFLFGPVGTGDLALTLGPYSMDFKTAADNTLVDAIGEWNSVGEETNADVNGSTLCLLLNIDSREADADMGKRRWTNLLYPLVAVAPMGADAEEANVSDVAYAGVPARAAKYPWGKAFTRGINGFSRTTKLRITSRNPLTMHTFVGNGALTTINLDYTPGSNDTGFVIKVFKEGVELTKTTQFTVDTGTKRVILAVAPAAGDRVVVLYEAIDLI